MNIFFFPQITISYILGTKVDFFFFFFFFFFFLYAE